MVKTLITFLQFERNENHNKWQSYLWELFAFGYKNAVSCFFPVVIFSLLAISHLVKNPYLPRYDFLLLACILVQAFMFFTKMETKDELLVITLFHILGVSMEIFKVNAGSWSYPEDAYTKIAGVPLYSGFMYASVASFMCQAWRRFPLTISHWPQRWLALSIGIAIYLNFFTHHFIPDLRWILAALVLIVFWKTKVHYNNNGIPRKMPVVLAFMLIGLFIWFAENIATFLGAWKYAYQHGDWHMVSYQKISSWELLVIVSFIIVAELKFAKANKNLPSAESIKT